jgi:hypothetical protein
VRPEPRLWSARGTKELRLTGKRALPAAKAGYSHNLCPRLKTAVGPQAARELVDRYRRSGAASSTENIGVQKVVPKSAARIV